MEELRSSRMGRRHYEERKTWKSGQRKRPVAAPNQAGMAGDQKLNASTGKLSGRGVARNKKKAEK